VTVPAEVEAVSVDSSNPELGFITKLTAPPCVVVADVGVIVPLPVEVAATLKMVGVVVGVPVATAENVARTSVSF
jgi:hypothetical protein